MRLPTALCASLSERIVRENQATDIQVDESATTIYLVLPADLRRLGSASERPIRPITKVTSVMTDVRHLTVPGLGVQGRALRYDVSIPHYTAVGGRRKIAKIPSPMPGVHASWRVTDEVRAKAIYMANCGQSPEMVARLLGDLDGIETDAATVNQWLAERSREQLVPARIPI